MKAYLQFGKWGGPYQTVAADDVKETEAPRLRTLSGYGRKLPTLHMLKYESRWRRVYAACFSNQSVLFTIIDGAEVVVNLES